MIFGFRSFTLLLLSVFLSSPASGSHCTEGERSSCSDRGYCDSEGDCVCDDYLHYWPSEHCSTWHDGRELEPGQYCYPNTVDQYCSWMGVCSADGNTCNCFDSEHRYSEDRCFTWHPSSTPPTPSPPPSGVPSTCIPGERSYCSHRGYCNAEGSTCVCDDYLHYWPSERCSTWHDGRELQVGQCCYPNTVDQYCSWMGTCSGDGNTCNCFDADHRSTVDRCYNWYPDSSAITFAPTPAPSFSPLTLSPRVGNQSCLYISLIDNFGDGWDTDVSLLYETINLTIGSKSVIKGTNGYKIEGCLPKLAYSHPIRLSIFSESSSRYLWEIQWSAQIISSFGNSEIFFGGYDTLFEFGYDFSADSYTMNFWDGLWVYPEESEACANLPGPSGCSNFALQFTNYTTNSTGNYTGNSTGGEYHEASWVITDLSFLDVINFGIPWGTGIIDNSISNSCNTCLQDGEYVLRVSGANYEPQTDIKWTFCGVSGGASTQLTFVISHGVCTPILPLMTLQALVFNDICPAMPIYPTSAPTLFPPTAHPTPFPPTPHPTTASPVPLPTPYPSTVPSLFPTHYPTLSSTEVPVIINVTHDDDDEDEDSGCVVLEVEVTITPLGGTVYCGSFPSTYTLTDVWAVILQNHWAEAPESADYPPGTLTSIVEITICSLDLYTSYSFYCVVTDSNDNPVTTIDDSNSNSVTVFITYPIASTLYTSSSGYALSELTQYGSLTSEELSLFTVSFHLDHAPSNSVTVGLQFFNITTNAVTSNVNYSPTSYIITSSAVGDALKGTFLVYGVPGTYNIKLTFSGTNAASFLPSNTVTITILPSLSTLPILMPVISTALFDYSGARIIVTFDVPTDFAITIVDTNIWNCNKIFTFTGVDEASCVWVDSMTVVITLNYYGRSSTLVIPGQNITLLNNVLKGATTSPTAPYTSPSTASLSIVETHVLPAAVLIGPTEIVLCSDLVIDPTLSVGQGGRDWKDIRWKVTAADGGDVSGILTILSTSSTASPITISSTLLRPTTYSISLGLLNFLQDLSEQVSYTTLRTTVIADGPIVTLMLSSPSIINVERSSILVLDAHADLAYCLTTSTTIPDSPVATFVWRVKKNNVLDTSIVSISPNPASFVVQGNQFDLESVYEINVEVTYESTWSTSKSVIAFGVESSVTALISGGMSSVSVHSSETLEIDALASIGTNLAYHWSCLIVSTPNYGTDYFQQIGFTPSGAVLTFPPATFIAGARYQITLVVTSTSVAGSVSDSTTLTIYVPVSIADVAISLEDPVPSSPFNIQDTLQVLMQLQSATSTNIEASWSIIQPLTFDLTYPGTSLVPLSNEFTPLQLTSGILYPFGVAPNTLAPGSYTFRLSASQTGVSDRFMDITVVCTSPPFGGDIAVTPSTGFEYTTVFSLSGIYWVSDPQNYPLLYQFVYQVAPAFDWSSSYSLVNALQRAPYSSTILPAGDASASNSLVVAVIVMDIWGAQGHASSSITVTPDDRRKLSTLNSFDSYMNSFSAANAAHQLDGMISSFQLALNVVNDPIRPDCSLAQNCAALHRESCSTVSQTCGACLENFVGVYGDSNSPCHPSSESRSSIGEACSSNVECEYEFCDTTNNVCAFPLQSCPVGLNGNVCSGHGTCSFITLQGESISDCTVDNTNCFSTCDCETEYGGRECGLSNVEVSTMRLNRASLCDALDILTQQLTFGNDRLQTQVNYLLEIFDLYSTPLEECKATLTTLVDYLTATNPSMNTNANIAQIISSFAEHEDVLPLVSTFQSSIYDGMIAGQTPILLSTRNYRVAFTYESLLDLDGGDVVLSAPLTDIETFYHKSPTNITLPNSGLSMCSGFVNYAKLALIVWGQSPYEIPTKQNLFMISTYSTGSNSASPTDVSDQYSLNLYLNDEIDVSTHEPVCYEYDFTSSTLIPCANCEVTSSSSTRAHLSCDDAASYFCPSPSSSSSSSSSSSFGTTSVVYADGLNSPKIYTLEVKEIPSAFGGETTQDNMSTGVLSFVVIYVFCVLAGVVSFFWWDRKDRQQFIETANAESTQKQNSTFILSAAFDKSGRKSNLGVKLSQIAASSSPRGTSLSHDRAYSRDQKSLFALNNPLNRASSAVDRSGRPIPEISVQSTPRTTTSITDTLPSSSIVDLDSLSERQSQPNAVAVVDSTLNQMDQQDDSQILTWSDFPISSLLSEHSMLGHLLFAISRHHKWVRIFTYPSMRRSRLIRFIVAASDLLFIIFTNTIFYMIFYPDHGLCQSDANTSLENCHSQHSKFEPGVPLCQWHDNGSCTLREPPFTVKFIIEVCMIVIVFSSIPRSIFQYLLEKICAKRPIVETVGLNPANVLAPEPTPVNAGYKIRTKNDVIGRRASLIVDVSTDLYALTHCDHMNVTEESEVILRERPILDNNTSNTNEFNQIINIQRNLLNMNESGALKPLSWRQWFLFQTSAAHLEWKINRARTEASALIRKLNDSSEAGPEQTDYSDMCILQHFILEQVSPITRYALKKDIFEMDHASPGRVNFWPWISAWIAVIAVWIFMASWVISWSVNNGAGPARAWGLVLGIVIIADMITNELSQIYFIHVHMTSKLRPQLREIFSVLSDILEYRLQHKSPRYGGLRVPQHLSPACRASRSQSLAGHLSSHILSLIDDIDVQMCRQSRLVDLRDVGLFSWMTLFHPALLNTAHDMFQQAAMDIVVPIAWCCFILLNSAIFKFSVYLLIGLYIGGFLFMLWFYFFFSLQRGQNSKPYQELTVSGRRKSMKDPSELELVNTPDNAQYSPHRYQQQQGEVAVLGSDMETDHKGPSVGNYLALPVSDGTTTKPDDVELYFSSDIFSAQQMIISNENEYTL